MMTWQRRKYPKQWNVLARACKEAAGWQCEHCGMPQGAEVVSPYTGNCYRLALHAAHLDHDPWNPCPRLRALCPRCHGRYDYQCGQRRRWMALEMLKHRRLLQNGRQERHYSVS
jgi:hypothetical protein